MLPTPVGATRMWTSSLEPTHSSSACILCLVATQREKQEQISWEIWFYEETLTLGQAERFRDPEERLSPFVFSLSGLLQACPRCLRVEVLRELQSLGQEWSTMYPQWNIVWTEDSSG
jgi:hypothetical protein